MLRRFTNPGSTQKMLMGNDTDVSDEIIISYGNGSQFVFFGILIDEEKEKLYPEKPIVLTKEEFKKHFDLQYGSPMHYISKEDYEWITS